MTRLALAAAALALLTATAAQASGRAEVRYRAPESFTDAGLGRVERERTQALLAARLERLARALPDGQVLQVEFLDVDLAGELDTLALHRVRVLGQLPDAPRLHLRYALQLGSRVLASGEERLVDLGYLNRSVGLVRGEPLAYEARLLDEWFHDRFGRAVASVR